MNTSDRCVSAGAIAFVVLLMAAGQASGQHAHEHAPGTSAEHHPPVAEAEVSRPAAAPSSSKPHDHASHGAASLGAGEGAGEGDGEAAEHGDENNLPKPLAWLGRFHPPVTHFPIALLTAAALAELLLMRTGQASYRNVVRFCVRLGAAAALLAATLGWCFAGVRLIDQEWVMTAHRWAGTSVALLSAGLLYLHAQAETSSNDRQRFRIVLFLAAGLVGATGFLGGALIYGLDHYAW